jgi:predicted RNA-binding Zn ribbon-like protein
VTFLFVGGDPALDLVNTVVVDGGAPLDLIPTPADLAAWTAAAGLGTPAVSPHLHAAVLAVRTALKVAFDAVIAGAPVPVTGLNEALATAPGTALRATPDGLRLEPLVDDPATLPWVLADRGAHVLTGRGLLRRCANHDTCVLLFLDTSRSHTRRWCSMELCGNRSKVAAHAARASGRSPGAPRRRPPR